MDLNKFIKKSIVQPAVNAIENNIAIKYPTYKKIVKEYEKENGKITNSEYENGHLEYKKNIKKIKMIENVARNFRNPK